MDTIAIDGLNEDAFRRSIESRLRQGLAENAVQKLRALLAPYAGPGKILPERFLTIKASDLVFHGWEGLGDAIARHDRPGWPVTALAISFGWPGEEPLQFDAQGGLNPLIETSFFTDEAYPFSQSAREDLLDGYSYHGCSWADQGESSSSILSLAGIDDLHGALAALEANLLSSEEPDEEGVRAGSLGSCLLSALLVQAVGERLAREGLPRPLCVLSGSNGVYPYFDAPVAGMPEEVLKADEDDETGPHAGAPAPRYSSLLVTGIPRARKRAVLVLEENAEERALRNANLRALNHPEAAEPAVSHQSEPEHLSSELENAGITPAPGGPLMSKSSAKKSWDFRDMLGEPHAEESMPDGPDDPLDLDAFASESDEPGPDFAEALAFEPLDPIVEAGLPEVQPEEPSAPRIARLPSGPLERDEPAQPGFALLEPTIEERLQLLVAPPAPRIELVEPVPEPSQTEIIAGEEPLDLRAEDPRPADLGPAWPLGIGWLEDAESAAPVAAPVTLSQRSDASLFSRLIGWIARRR